MTHVATYKGVKIYQGTFKFSGWYYINAKGASFSSIELAKKFIK